MAAKEFKARAAEAKERGFAYCGFHRGEVDPAEMLWGQCRQCRTDRLVHRSTYRPPRVRQSLTAIAPPTSWAEVLAAVAAGHAETAEVFESRARLVAAEVARAEVRETALSALAELQASVKTPRTPVDGFSPSVVPETPNPATTSVEAIWQTKDIETQARLDALRDQLNGEQ